MPRIDKQDIIFYFSGTGNTRIAANLIAQKLSTAEKRTVLLPVEDFLKDPHLTSLSAVDLVGIGYPIHCFNAPRIIFELIDKLPAPPKKVFTFMTAADSFSLNYAGAFFVRQRLIKKHYDVFHQSLIVMPSNIFFSQSQEAIAQVFRIAQRQIAHITNEIAQGKRRILAPAMVLQVIAFFLSAIERIGARIFGKDLAVSDSCDLCQVCIQRCPAQNIYLRNKKIRFRFQCLACLRCVYLCPQRAIMPRIEKFAVLQNGYTPERLFASLQDRPSEK